MAIFTFQRDEIQSILEQATRSNSPVLLVKDHGVYLMVGDKEYTKQEMNTLVYVERCDPNKDVDWYDNSRSLVGGDDFADKVLSVADAKNLLALEWDKFVIKVTSTTISVSCF